MNKKIFLLVAVASLLASSIAGGILRSEHVLNTITTYKKVDLKFWNDESHDSHLSYQQYVSAIKSQNEKQKIGHHDTHHYQEALINSDATAKQTVSLTAYSSFDNPHRVHIDFYLKSAYKNGDEAIAFISGANNKLKNGYGTTGDGDISLANGQKEISDITGFSIRSRATYGDGHHNGFLYLTIFYGKDQSNKTMLYLA